MTTSPRGSRYSRVSLQILSLSSPRTERLLCLIPLYVRTLELYRITATEAQLRQLLLHLTNLNDLGIFSLTTIKGKYIPFRLFPIFKDEARQQIFVFNTIFRIQFPSNSLIYDPALPIVPNFTPQNACTSYLSEALLTFPNVDEVSVVDLAPEDLVNFEDVQPIKLGKFSLRTTPYFNGLEDDVLKMLCNLDMIIGHLEFKHQPIASEDGDMTYIEPVASVKLVKKFILSQKESLQALEIYQVREDGLTPSIANYCPFPLALPNLKFLEVHKAFVKNIADVINYLPELLEVRFRFGNDTKWEELLTDGIVEHNSIHTLRIEYIDGNSLRRLLKYFPKLRILQLSNCDVDVLTVLGEFFGEFMEADIIQGFASSCEDCANNIHCTKATFFKIPFSDKTNVVRMVKIPVDSKFPGLRFVLLRKCAHYISIPFLFFDHNNERFDDLTASDRQSITGAKCVFDRPNGTKFLWQMWSLEPVEGSDASTFHLPIGSAYTDKA